MAILEEFRGTAGFLVSEANNMYRSREEEIVNATGAALLPGTIMGKVTGSGEYVRHNAGASNGSQTEAGILFEAIAEGEVQKRTLVVRDAEVVGAHLTYEDGADAAQITATNAALKALGIIVR